MFVQRKQATDVIAQQFPPGRRARLLRIAVNIDINAPFAKWSYFSEIFLSRYFSQGEEAGTSEEGGSAKLFFAACFKFNLGFSADGCLWDISYISLQL